MSYSSDHLLFIAPTAYPLGGVAVWLHYLLNGLKKRGVNVTLGAVSGHYHDVPTYIAHYPFDQVEVIDCAVGGSYARVQAIAKAIERVNPTMVLSVNIPDVYLATRYLRNKGMGDYACISTLHGILPRLFQDIVHYHDVIDHIVVTNKLTELMLLESTEFQASQLHYAPYGVEEHCPDLEPTKASDKLRILYSGRVDQEQKRCQDLVGICDALCQNQVKFELVIAGSGPWKSSLLEQLDSLQQRWDKPSLYNDLGVVRYDEMTEKVYHQVDCLLLTSDWETGPIVVWEAMACGLPVVTSQYKGMQAEGALKHDVNCLSFPIGDVNTAASHLQALLDQTTVERLVKAGRQTVEQRYSQQKSIEQWAQVLRHIAVLQAKTVQDNRKPNPFNILPNGRLDHLFGVHCSNMIRRILKKPETMTGAGDEWPHAHAGIDHDYNVAFKQTLQALEPDALIHD